MISSVGVRSLVENQVDLTDSRNLIITALTITLAIGISYGCEGGALQFGSIAISGLAVAAIVGILAAVILPTDHKSLTDKADAYQNEKKLEKENN